MPRYHAQDGGRYIGTANLDITRDRESGWVNAGAYRVMIHDAQHLGFFISPGKHGRVHRQQYFDAAASRARWRYPSATTRCCSWPRRSMCRTGQSEYAWAGGVRGEPVASSAGQ